jgi:hypothetical protein
MSSYRSIGAEFGGAMGVLFYLAYAVGTVSGLRIVLVQVDFVRASSLT